MVDVKQSLQNASYERKDPLLIYKLESFNIFYYLNMYVLINIY